MKNDKFDQLIVKSIEAWKQYMITKSDEDYKKYTAAFNESREAMLNHANLQ